MPRELIGETLLNQFRVENFIASGGMATIYRVWDIQRSVPLAMKVLNPELAEDPTFMARFEREANSLQRLIHPNIVPFYGLYRAGDMTFLLERYIDGPSLEEVLRRRAGLPLPLRDALIFFKALYTSLGYAHAQGIIHCDVKPGNVLIDQGGHITLTDFGIARYMDSAVTTSSAIGTPLYMAPEQIRGERVSPQTDIYSLGVLLFELLTGQRPFRGVGDIPAGVGTNQADRIRYQQMYAPPPDPRQFNPNLPEGLARVVLRAMVKEPAARYPNVQAMADEIAAAVSARFNTLPDRVNVAEIMLSNNRPVSEAQPDDRWAAGAAPVEVETPAVVDVNADELFPQAGLPLSDGEGWDDGIPHTLPGRPPAPRPAPARRSGVAPAGLLLAIIGGLVLLGALAFLGSRLVQRLAHGSNAPIVPLPGQQSSRTPGAAQSPAGPTPAAATATAAAVGTNDFPIQGEIAVLRGSRTLLLLNPGSDEMSRVPSPPDVTELEINSPQWSPDGSHLVWISRYNGRQHVVVMDMTEREPYQLPAGEAYKKLSAPAWLPDGKNVSFWASGGSGDNWLVTADATSGKEVNSVSLTVYRNLLVWNWVTGQAAYYMQTGSGGQVMTGSPDFSTAKPVPVQGTGYAPAWSNDGQWLAFQADAGRAAGEDEIWVMRSDGSEVRAVTSSPEGTWSRAPTWSPDGRMIAFVSNQAGSTSHDFGELFVVDLQSGKVRQVTNTGGEIYDWRPAWRPR